MDHGPTAYDRRHVGVREAERLAATQDDVVSRAQLERIGVSRFAIGREVRRGRWRLIGRHTVAIHRGPLPDRAWWRRAIWEVGCHARLDGSTALASHGMSGYADEIHVSVPHGSRPVRTSRVRVHEIRNWDDAQTTERSGIPTSTAAHAVVRAATWCRSKRQAALLIVMAVQQRIVRADELLAVIAARRRTRWRRLLLGVALDASDGVQAMSELDFARACRSRGLPEPSRQVVRRGDRGRSFLNAYFDQFDLIVELEGAHHDELANAIDDSLRQNEFSVGKSGILRIPVVGWRLDPTPYLDQLKRALRARGWRPPS